MLYLLAVLRLLGQRIWINDGNNTNSLLYHQLPHGSTSPDNGIRTPIKKEKVHTTI